MNYNELLNNIKYKNKLNNYFIIKETNASLDKGKEFVCKVNPNDKFKYVLLYVNELNLWLCWKRREKKIEDYNVQKKHVVRCVDSGYLYKGKEYLSWGKEKVLIIKTQKIETFINELMNL